ncbi:hypothetical protein, partial [Candidatus Amarobacter glycogenicus]|uniref:hypothetical protein n=1 Tax=Candidatus Amarobacter glycogenicus TaxID=3140699 RepID=UPI0031CCA590
MGDRAQNMNYQPSCWGVYYNLLDQGIPGLDWQWDYAAGQSVSEFAAANLPPVQEPFSVWLVGCPTQVKISLAT